MSHDLIVEAERLGALINGHPEKVPAALPKLLELLTSGNDPATLATVITALGRAWDEKAGLAVLPYASHADDQVRLAVARAAPGGVASLGAKEAVADVLHPAIARPRARDPRLGHFRSRLDPRP